MLLPTQLKKCLAPFLPSGTGCHGYQAFDRLAFARAADCAYCAYCTITGTATRSPLIQARTAATPASHLNGALH